MERYRKKTDEELVRETLAGDARAYEALVNRYEQKIYNIIYRIVSDRAAASDILQETFTKAYRSLNTFKGRSKFTTWLYRIAVNFSLMHKRGRKNILSLDNPVNTEGEGDDMTREIPDWSDNPEANARNREFRGKIDAALNLLPDEYKSVVLLKDVQGMQNREVGKILNITVPAVKSRLHRARMFLRERLSEYFNSGAKT